MSYQHLILAVALVACSSCARTAVTTGAIRTGSSAPASAKIYDDSYRTISAGRELDLRLLGALSSETATVNHAFDATTASDLRNGSRVILPAGSIVHGVVRGVEKADESEGIGRLVLSFGELVANGHATAIDATAGRLFERGGLGDERDSTALEPALIGGILAGLTDELTTSIIAPDGSIVAVQPGADAALAAGTIVRIRMNTAVIIR
jgi:hypothetical protein